MLKRSALFLLSAVLCAALLSGCTTTSSTPSNIVDPRSGIYTYSGTQSPGDVWSWTISESTIIGTNETTATYYSGTYTTYTSGFSKMTVTDSNDPSVPLDGTATAYFLEYPNTMLIVKPANDSDDNVIICAASATAAPSAGQYNFVNLPWLGWTASSDAYGTVEVSVSSGLYTFNVRTYDLAGTQTNNSLETGFSFSSGRLAKAGHDLQVFMTPSGCYMGDSGPGNGGFVGAAYQSVDIADLVSKNYRGVLFQYDPGTGNGETQAVGAEPHPSLSNALSGFSFDDVETGARASDGPTLAFGPQDSSGVLTGTMNNSGIITTFRMVIAQVNSKYIVFGVATNDSGNPENFIVVEQ
jgi:hypothetical protein